MKKFFHLFAMIIFMVAVVIQNDMLMRAFYMSLVVLSAANYVQDYFKITRTQEKIFKRVGVVAFIVAVILLITDLYLKFIA